MVGSLLCILSLGGIMSNQWKLQLKSAIVFSLLAGVAFMTSLSQVQAQEEPAGQQSSGQAEKVYENHQITDLNEEEKNFWRQEGLLTGNSYALKENTKVVLDCRKKHLAQAGFGDYKDPDRATSALVWGSINGGSLDLKNHNLSLVAIGGNRSKLNADMWQGTVTVGLALGMGSLTISNPGDIDLYGEYGGIDISTDREEGGGFDASLYIKNGGTNRHTVKIRMNNPKQGGAPSISPSYIGLHTNGYVGNGRIFIDGNVDIEAGTGAYSHCGPISIGGGRIIANGNAALRAESKGKLLVNADVNSSDGTIKPHDATRDVYIEGDITSIQESVIGVALPTKKSKLVGIFTTNSHVHVVNEPELLGSYGYLYLGEGAVWEHRKYGTGRDYTGTNGEGLVDFGNSKLTTFCSNDGVIYQRDKRDIVIREASGDGVTVIYDHKNNGTKPEDYEAGNVCFGSLPNNYFTVMTDASGIDIHDKTTVINVLSRLAEKIHSNNTRVVGRAVLGDSLTSSAFVIAKGYVEFGEKGESGEIGQLQKDHETIEILDPPNPGQGSITGDSTKDQYYTLNHIRTGEGTYTFNKDELITLFGKVPGVNALQKVTIDATGHILAFKVRGYDDSLEGIVQASGNPLEIKAKQLKVTVINKNTVSTSSGAMARRVKGICNDGDMRDRTKLFTTEIMGNVSVKATGADYVIGMFSKGKSLIHVTGNVDMVGEDNDWGIVNETDSGHYHTSGLYAGAAYADDSKGPEVGGQITIDGAVNLRVKGSGIFANGGTSTVRVKKGGKIYIGENSEVSHYAIVAECGSVYFNVNDDGSQGGTADVEIDGNVITDRGAVNAKYEPEHNSRVFLGLTTDKSYLHGMILDDHREEDNNAGFYGQNTVYLQNGARWIHEMYGKLPDNVKESKVYKLVGGIDDAHAGIIEQKNGGHRNIEIQNYEGHSKVIYGHVNKGDQPNDYGNPYNGGEDVDPYGDIHIKHAEKGATITLITDNTGMNVSDKEEVRKVLHSLAGKLYYDNYVQNERNLKGRAAIADGLLSSSKVLDISEMGFKDENGQGKVDQPNPPQPNPPQPNPPQPNPPQPNPPQPNPPQPNPPQPNPPQPNPPQPNPPQPNPPQPNPPQPNPPQPNPPEWQNSEKIKNQLFDLWKTIPGNENKTREQFDIFMKGETLFDTWKSMPGNEGKTQSDFDKFLKGPSGDPGQSEVPGGSGGQVIPGTSAYQESSYETSIMKGTRSTMLSSALLWQVHSNDALRRLGDIRLSQTERGVWAKYEGGNTEFIGKDNSDKQVDISQRYNFMAIGYDTKVGDWTIGGVIDHGKADDKYFGEGDGLIVKGIMMNGVGKVTSTGITLYGNLQNKDGAYIDLITKYGQVKSEYDLKTAVGLDSVHGEYKAPVSSFSVEYGKRMIEKTGLYYEPSVEMTFSRVASSDHTVISAKKVHMNIHQDEMTSTIARLGVSIGKETNESHIFAKLAVAHEFNGKLRTAFAVEKSNANPKGDFKEVKLDFSGTWLDIELGGSYKMSDTSYIYGTFTKNFGAKLDSKWRLDAGIRFAF